MLPRIKVVVFFLACAAGRVSELPREQLMVMLQSDWGWVWRDWFYLFLNIKMVMLCAVMTKKIWHIMQTQTPWWSWNPEHSSWLSAVISSVLLLYWLPIISPQERVEQLACRGQQTPARTWDLLRYVCQCGYRWESFVSVARWASVNQSCTAVAEPSSLLWNLVLGEKAQGFGTGFSKNHLPKPDWRPETHCSNRLTQVVGIWAVCSYLFFVFLVSLPGSFEWIHRLGRYCTAARRLHVSARSAQPDSEWGCKWNYTLYHHVLFG